MYQQYCTIYTFPHSLKLHLSHLYLTVLCYTLLSNPHYYNLLIYYQLSIPPYLFNLINIITFPFYDSLYHKFSDIHLLHLNLLILLICSVELSLFLNSLYTIIIYSLFLYLLSGFFHLIRLIPLLSYYYLYIIRLFFQHDPCILLLLFIICCCYCLLCGVRLIHYSLIVPYLLIYILD